MDNKNAEYRIFNEDCFATLKRIEDKSVSLLLQDPPFGVTRNKWDIKPDLNKMWPEWIRVSKDNAAIIFFATQPFVSELILSMPRLFRYDLIWYKSSGTGFLNSRKMPLRNHEHILVFYKKLPVYNPQMGVGVKKRVIQNNRRSERNYGSFGDTSKVHVYDSQGKRHPQSVIDFSNANFSGSLHHPTQKPLSLIRYLLVTYSNPGELVFDGYLGSGTTLIASYLEGRSFIGAEMKQEYYKGIVRRFDEQRNQPHLFEPGKPPILNIGRTDL